MPAIPWLPWSELPFARARAEGKPLLLSVTASWCRFSAEMDRTSYADERVAALVTSLYVPVRVDADRRPDLGHRYDLGGWPTTALLSADGEVLCGGTYADAARLAELLKGVYAAYVAGEHARAVPVPRAVPAQAAPATDSQLIAQVLQAFDVRHGGFGDAPKFPHTAPLWLALDVYRENGSPEWRDAAITSLDAMGWGPLYDEQHGGFFRCAGGRDWGHPSEEKLLDVNASLLSLYVEAFEVLQFARYAERAEDVLRYLQTWLADPVDGGWGGSQRADPDYYARCRAGATGAPAPPVDRTLYADWNAAMVSAALHAGRVMHDAALSEFAIRSLERLDLLCYRPGAGMAHYIDAALQVRRGAVGEVRGLLADQIAMAAAHLDAFDATGNVVYQMMAEELVLYAIRTMWDEEAGGFFDRVPDEGGDLGLLRNRSKPFVTNCAAARMLSRLARTSATGEFARCADRILHAMSTRAAAEGPVAAEYILALRDSALR